MIDKDTAVDLQVGEARIIRDITTNLFDLHSTTVSMRPVDWEYQSTGYPPLVKFLEEKHSAPVIITNGANHALYAVMQVLKSKGFNKLGFRIPYWNRLTEIAKQVGINYVPYEGTLLSDKAKTDSYLLVAPNNPDGHLPPMDMMRMCSAMLKDQEKPLIHDAVYYTRSYLPIDYPIESIGDVQLFSASKSYGLSSLRVGYMVIYNASFYQELKHYVELSTVGVSVPSQKLFLRILRREEQLPILKTQFEKLTRQEIAKARNIFKGVKPELVDLPANYDRDGGIFAWVKPKVQDLFMLANVSVLDGEIFGREGYVRINLTAGNEMIEEAVKRINGVSI